MRAGSVGSDILALSAAASLALALVLAISPDGQEVRERAILRRDPQDQFGIDAFAMLNAEG